jgi:hypothetical protein
MERTAVAMVVVVAVAVALGRAVLLVYGFQRLPAPCTPPLHLLSGLL